jgi:hypothetical protein
MVEKYVGAVGAASGGVRRKSCSAMDAARRCNSDRLSAASVASKS